MSADWAALDDRAWQLYSGMHRMLLRLAGRLPDELITRTRAMLAGGDLAYLPDTVAIAAVERGVPLTAQEVGLLREVFAALGFEGEPTASDEITLTTATPVTGHTFSPDVVRPPRVPARLDLTGGVPDELADLEDDLLDLVDHLVVDALSGHAGVAVVRRAWRDGPGGARRVYLVEVDPGVPAWEPTLEAQTEASQTGESDPQVEVYWTGDDLPPYHRAALEAAVLLWRR
ncbi:hypothetical protein SAMN05421505_14024 [Sinosporangium album]|uniref:Uncharacterized protein n=1 Tax=Sinosporangium album TaxID=504805 RepID=A0A1G8IZD6_9ACTN|nr:hypothetical protein [Sinosporangium album]SDI24428.1 hypothetical protein SAMN05421505_14024 [Sinosporangium album]